jgi:hypothetical protein
MFLRGSGLLVGLIALGVALVLCGCGALYIFAPEAGGATTETDIMNLRLGAAMVCCLPGLLFAIIGALAALFPFTFGRRK